MDIWNFENKSSMQILEFFGNLFDSYFSNKNLTKLLDSIQLTNNINIDTFDNHSLAILNYFLGNAWSYVAKLKNPIPNFDFEVEEIDKEITFYRKAFELIQGYDDKFISCQILTNLGNLFSHIGRFVEAQEYYNLCLDIDDKFGMAIGNKGFSLFHYAREVFDPYHQFIFIQYARRYLKDSLKFSDVYVEAKKDFSSIVKQIEDKYPISILDDLKKYDNYYNTLEKEEVEYRTWCAENRLFLNPLNDVLTDSVVATDYLFIPSMVLSVYEKPIFHTMYNQLKQEFVSSRYLFYESLLYNGTHFSDKNVTLMDTLDYSAYSFRIEKTKIAFRVCYSIFDKIAYFLNLYFKLGNKSDKVTFRNIWYVNLKKDHGLNNKLAKAENWALRGLYWLSKDLYEKEFDITIEPQAKEIAKIRNYIEHKSFKVIETLNFRHAEEAETYEINRDLFIEKTLKVIKLSRSALMYLAYSIYEEESKRDKFRNRATIMPVNFINLDDELKT
ncbi:MAG TPA: tetratricopeptide repeat protein [Bacteroidales bacterium]|nr:tetratricopeptide repeat protein [Bacteroidales bacterium]